MTRFVVDHRDHNLIVKASFTALHHPDESVLYFVPLLTIESLRRNVELFTTAGRPHGDLKLITPSGGEVTCDGLERKVDYPDDTVWSKIPQACINGPRWVQAGLGMGRYGDRSEYLTDDAMLDGDFGEQKPKLGPKVLRG